MHEIVMKTLDEINRLIALKETELADEKSAWRRHMRARIWCHSPGCGSTLAGDPTRSPLISEYLAFIRQEQGLSGVLPKSASTMERNKMDKFMKYMAILKYSRKKGNT